MLGIKKGGNAYELPPLKSIFTSFILEVVDRFLLLLFQLLVERLVLSLLDGFQACLYVEFLLIGRSS